ncbi:MAG: hypothetical protein LUG18_02175 [Candidatus Azobacteroides sp.]|nr:hypothetical protein [Candidatus Azobacteroides sp.]
MKKKNSIISKSLVFITGILLITSCQSTKVISSWSLPSPPANIMDKVLVLGVMANREYRDAVEQNMVQELTKAGVNATSATSVFGPKGFQDLTEEEVTNRLKGSSYTSVMIISLIDKEQEQNYTPGTRYTTPRIVGYNRYYRRYLVVYDSMYTPGYFTTNTNYIMEAEIYTINDGDELVYSAQTRSYDPNSTKSMAESFSKSIVTELKEKGIIRNYNY